MWDESKHPRDKIGRFANKEELERAKYIYSSDNNYNSMSVDELREICKVDLNFFSDKNNRHTVINISDIPSPPTEVYGFANSERLNTAHHIQHAIDMGYKGQKEYERAAIHFWRNGNGIIYYSKVRNRFYKYDKNKSLFLATDSQGIIHTFRIYSNNKFKNKFTHILYYIIY